MWFDPTIVNNLRALRNRILFGEINEGGDARIPVWKVVSGCEDTMEVYSQLDDPELRASGKLGQGHVVCSVCRKYSPLSPCNGCFEFLSEDWPVKCVVCLDKKSACSCKNGLR